MFKPGDKARHKKDGWIGTVESVDVGFLAFTDLSYGPTSNYELVAPTPVPEPISSFPFTIGDRVEPNNELSRQFFGSAKTGRVTGINDETKEVIVLCLGRNRIRIYASLVRKVPTTVNAR